MPEYRDDQILTCYVLSVVATKSQLAEMFRVAENRAFKRVILRRKQITEFLDSLIDGSDMIHGPGEKRTMTLISHELDEQYAMAWECVVSAATSLHVVDHTSIRKLVIA